MADLKGRVAVVTGASRGVGRGIAQGLAEAGCTVYVTGRSRSEAEPPAALTVDATAAEVSALGGVGIPVTVDHGDDAQIAALFERVRAEQGRLDVLVNNVFRIPEPPVFGGGFWTHPVAIWDDMVGIGCRAHYVASVHAAPLMVAQRSGLIVNISSAGGGEYLFSVAYGTGKAAVDRMAQDMAHELRPFGVAAVSLWPGVVKTEFLLAAVDAGDVRFDLSGAETPRFSGRAVAALARDPDLMEKTGQILRVADLAREYRFPDLED
ncbi:MAG: SDR family NAD(P)-dependent oxidoreductase [Pseudomonadales bacterium]|jgi:dehydrogenase/reductase SDR family protein 1|nr:SDR family NAD(P)-dependent oxidoreductase [Pseudomonadales bacterium]